MTLLSALTGLILLFQPLQEDPRPSSCEKCHATEHREMGESVHLKAALQCVDCHGGDPTERTQIKAKAPGTGYKGKIARADVPQLCASCHSDVQRMNPYGLSTDQHAQYMTSRHGQALAKGDKDVATCVDCHKSHDIRAVRDSASPVYPKNVPATCGRCHSDEEKMTRHNLRSDVEQLYSWSAHAELLTKKSDLSAPTCVTCHGNHGAVPPGFRQIEEVCGKCHIKQKEGFDQSPHAKETREGNFKGCVTCHSNHRIAWASDKIFETSCKKCHDDDSKAMATRNALRSTMLATRSKFEAVKERVNQAGRMGLYTDEEQIMLDEAKTTALQLAPTQHALNPARLKALGDQADATMDAITQRIEEKERGERSKKIILLPILAFLLLMSLGFWKKQRQLQKTISIDRSP